MIVLANSTHPDEMPHYTICGISSGPSLLAKESHHQGLHCMLRHNQSAVKEIQIHLKIITCDPSKYTMGHLH